MAQIDLSRDFNELHQLLSTLDNSRKLSAVRLSEDGQKIRFFTDINFSNASDGAEITLARTQNKQSDDSLTLKFTVGANHISPQGWHSAEYTSHHTEQDAVKLLSSMIAKIAQISQTPIKEVLEIIAAQKTPLQQAAHKMGEEMAKAERIYTPN